MSLKVRAFDKDYVVPKKKLAGLSKLLANGIRISYEEGYAELGGRTIHVQLQMGFTSQTTEKALITVTEDGEIVVGEIEIEEEKAQPSGAADSRQPATGAHNSP